MHLYSQLGCRVFQLSVQRSYSGGTCSSFQDWCMTCGISWFTGSLLNLCAEPLAAATKPRSSMSNIAVEAAALPPLLSALKSCTGRVRYQCQEVCSKVHLVHQEACTGLEGRAPHRQNRATDAGSVSVQCMRSCSCQEKPHGACAEETPKNANQRTSKLKTAHLTNKQDYGCTTVHRIPLRCKRCQGDRGRVFGAGL